MSEPSNRDIDAKVIAFDSKRVGFRLYRDLEVSVSKIWLVQGMLGAGEASAFYGKPGDGKSVLVEDMALHIAAGKYWHQRKVKGGAVIYVALERRALVERRAIAFRQRHGIADLPFAIVGGVHDFREVRTADHIAGLVHQVEDMTGHNAVLLVIDTLSRALCGGDENSSKDIGALVNATSRLQIETKAHVLWIHHMPHDSASERLRGHGALLGALDTTVHIVKTADGTRTATVVKANDSQEGERVAFTLESETIGEDVDGTPTTAPVVVPVDVALVRTAKAKGNGWTKGLRLVHEAITATLNDGVPISHRVAHDGPFVSAVYVDDAREVHRQRYVHGGDGARAEAERKSWQRNIKEARNRNLIASGLNGGREIVWLVT
jgi:AAA domain